MPGESRFQDVAERAKANLENREKAKEQGMKEIKRRMVSIAIINLISFLVLCGTLITCVWIIWG